MKKVAIFLSCLLLIAVSLAPAASAIEIGTSYMLTVLTVLIPIAAQSLIHGKQLQKRVK
jgi:hypothetical protein